MKINRFKMEFFNEIDIDDLLRINIDEENYKLIQINDLEEIFGYEAVEYLEEQCELESDECFSESVDNFKEDLEAIEGDFSGSRERFIEELIKELEDIHDLESYSEFIFELNMLQQQFKDRIIKLMGIKDKIELRNNLYRIYYIEWTDAFNYGSVYQYGMILYFCKNKELDENKILKLNELFNIEKIYNDTYTNIENLLKLFNSYKSEGYYYCFVDLYKKYEELWSLIKSPDTFNKTIYDDKCISLYLYLKNLEKNFLYINKVNPKEKDNAEVLVPCFKLKLKYLIDNL